MIEYENYHCHSHYSNCLTQPDSPASILDYAKKYKERNQHVLCLSEHGNRSNVWEQFTVANSFKDYNMKALAAAECYFVPNRDPEIKDGRNFHLVIVAKNNNGFRELNKALSEANLSGFYRHARVDFDILSRLDYRNFLVTTACVGGIWKDKNYKTLCLNLKDIFKENFYLEIQHHPQHIQIETNQKILKIYRECGIPIIYGTDSHYVNKEDKKLRNELLLSLKKSTSTNDPEKENYDDDFDLYLPTAEEAFQMLKNQNIFSTAQIEEAMENTLQLREFEPLVFTTEKKIPNTRKDMPYDDRVSLYRKSVYDGYKKKVGEPTESEIESLESEMSAVCDTGTADYFIAMKEVVDKGIKYGGVLTTTGRGSGVSFATNAALGFTSINRLRCPVKLYPERFISRERLASGALPD